MLGTRICDLFGIELPIVSAGMGGVALARLATAVSEAGGMGTIALAGFTPDAIHEEIAAARRMTNKPLAVNLLAPFILPGILEAVMREPIDAITFFWGDPAEWIPRARGRAKIIWQCGSAREAEQAMRAGADAIIAQGFEAGGHVRGIVTTVALIPEVRDAMGICRCSPQAGWLTGEGWPRRSRSAPTARYSARAFWPPRKWPPIRCTNGV